jgi:hypothetical protein
MRAFGAVVTMVLSLIASIPAVAFAQDFPCPDPIKQTEANWKGEVNAKAESFLKLGEAQLKGNVEKTVVDLISKYDQSNRVAILQNLASTTCYMLRNSKQLTDEQKFDKWMAILPVLQGFMGDKKSEIDSRTQASSGNFGPFDKVTSWLASIGVPALNTSEQDMLRRMSPQKSDSSKFSIWRSDGLKGDSDYAALKIRKGRVSEIFMYGRSYLTPKEKIKGPSEVIDLTTVSECQSLLSPLLMRFTSMFSRSPVQVSRAPTDWADAEVPLGISDDPQYLFLFPDFGVYLRIQYTRPIDSNGRELTNGPRFYCATIMWFYTIE